MQRFIWLFLLMVLVVCSGMNKKAKSNIDISAVPVESGLISGIYNIDSSVMMFKGVPFAAPPVGDLRWKAPEVVAPWKGVKKCDHFSASAMQNKPAPLMMWSKEFMAPESPLSEDCLYLNVWTGAKNSDEKRPVIVWIHGGALTSGSGSVPLYNGEEIAKKGVVFVTINYRVGVFGFFAHPELTKESPAHVSGNYGILDQIAALKWVKKNIHAFGGDSTCITIDGQSAGAFSVNALMVSPLAKGLFHRAIAQSGGMFDALNSRNTDLKSAEENGVKIAEMLKTATISDLRKIPAEDLQKANIRTDIVIDNYVIAPAYETFIHSQHNDVPLLTGWNADEINNNETVLAKDFKAQIKANFGAQAEDFLKVFPAQSNEQATQSAHQFSALRIGWQNYCWATMQTKYGKQPSYLYYFNHVPPGLPNFGAFHSAEFGYALKTLKYWDRPFAEADYKLADIMSSYWVNFAATGNPNGPGLPEWPAFDPARPMTMEFGEPVRATDLPHKDQMDFLDRMNQALR